MNPEEVQAKLEEMLLPHASRQVRRVIENDVRFVHYTTAEAGLLILRNRNVWLCNANLMNDFSEVQHGLTCLSAVYNDKAGVGGRLQAVLEALEPGLCEKLQATFNARETDLRAESFLIAISEHGGGDEDRFGRLSMWRAYGGSGTGVAFVFNTSLL